MTYVLSLEVLQNGAECPCCGSEGGVEAVDIGLLHVRLLLDAEADLEVAALVVSAVAGLGVSIIGKYPPAVFNS